MKRKIIHIDEQKCTGCGLCIPGCPEGAIQLIDGKARVINDAFCDGLGACLGHCPEGAITIEQREAEAYDEKKVMANIVRQGPNVVKAHLQHLRDHNEQPSTRRGRRIFCTTTASPIPFPLLPFPQHRLADAQAPRPEVFPSPQRRLPTALLALLSYSNGRYRCT